MADFKQRIFHGNPYRFASLMSILSIKEEAMEHCHLGSRAPLNNNGESGGVIVGFLNEPSTDN